MKKIVLVNGLIAGFIPISIFFITMGLYHKNGNFEGGMWIGYASMLLGFSLIFVGIKNFRDKFNGGVISFGKGFKIGLLITLVASTLYVIGWLIDLYCFIPDFAEKYAAAMLDKLKASGADAAKIAAETKDMDNFVQLYKNPVMVVLFTYVEILPVGLIISLIAAAILKKSRR
ncbi:DUF4199 domain-containing protein [Ferruginibacter sp.]